MYAIGFGGGVNLFTAGHIVMSLGYRYQHLSDANISIHNPGADGNTFTLASRAFRRY